MANWKDHVPADERGGLIVEYDDGSAIFHSSLAGGAAPKGAWSTVTLMQVKSNGERTFRDYEAKNDWHLGVDL